MASSVAAQHLPPEATSLDGSQPVISMDQETALLNPFSPNYSYIFDFERRFNHASNVEWMTIFWHTSFYWVSLSFPEINP